MTKSIFINLLDAQDKEAGLIDVVGTLSRGEQSAGVHAVEPASFGAIPGAPFAYWSGERLRSLFTTVPAFEGAGRTAKQGLATADDFRFVRAWWEVPATLIVTGTAQTTPEEFRAQTFAGKRWVPFAKGGAYSPYYADIHLVVDWERDGAELTAFPGSVIRNGSYYFRPGLTWPLRTQSGLSVRAMPAGCIFGHKGPTALAPKSELFSMGGIFNSSLFRDLVQLQMAFGSYEVGVIQRTPVPLLNERADSGLDVLTQRCIAIKQELDVVVETSHLFCLPALLHNQGFSITELLEAWERHRTALLGELEQLQQAIDQQVAELYGISADEAVAGSNPVAPEAAGDEADEQAAVDNTSAYSLVTELVSYLVGVVFGRWDRRLASQPAEYDLPGPFTPLPVCSPGMLKDPTSDGITVSDAADPRDLLRNVRLQLDELFADGDRAEEEICAILGTKSLAVYLNGKFALDHFRSYSMSRRKAPMYWQLQSPKKHYGVWLYYPQLRRDTIYIALRDYVGPKLVQEQESLQALKVELAEAKLNGARDERLVRRVDGQEAVVQDVAAFRDELKAIADAGYDPDHSDGVIINMAPLYKLVPWKDAAACYKELKAGRYPWSSMHQRYSFR